MSFFNLCASLCIPSILSHVLTFPVSTITEKKVCDIKVDPPECRVDLSSQQRREQPKDNGNPPKRDHIARWCKVNETPKTHNCQDGSGTGA